MGQLLSEINWGHAIFFAAAAVALAAIGLAVVLHGRQNDGRVLGRDVFGGQAGYGKMLLALAIMVVSVVAACILGPGGGVLSAVLPFGLFCSSGWCTTPSGCCESRAVSDRKFQKR